MAKKKDVEEEVDEVEAGEEITLSKEDLANVKTIIAENARLRKENEGISNRMDLIQEEMVKATTGKSVETKAKKIGTEIRLRRISSTDAKIDGRLVLGWKKRSNRSVYQERNPQNVNQVDEYMDLIVDGVEGTVKMLYADFLNLCPQEWFVATKRELEDHVLDLGTVQKVAYDENQKTMISTGIEVPNQVVTKRYEYDIVIDNERKITLPNEFVNA